MYIAAPLSLFIGNFFSRVRTRLPFLFIIGITTTGFASYDYYPLFPWIGVFFAGYAVGRIVITNRIKLAAIRPNIFTSALAALGRISLIYYLLHQPALLAVFFAVNLLLSVTLNL